MNFGPPLRPHRTHFFLGLDLGQRCDHSALVVLERTRILTGAFDHANYTHVTAVRLCLRHAHRFPLHFPYLKIPNAIRSILPTLDPSAYAASPAPKTLAVDATGVGAPFVEILQRARLQARILPITITSGAQPHGNNVPRATLLSNLRILFETGALRLAPNAPHFNQLQKELTTLSLHDGRTSHDDLAFALALAAWPAPSTHDSAPPNAISNRRNNPRGCPADCNHS